MQAYLSLMNGGIPSYYLKLHQVWNSNVYKTFLLHEKSNIHLNTMNIIKSNLSFVIKNSHFVEEVATF